MDRAAAAPGVLDALRDADNSWVFRELLEDEGLERQVRRRTALPVPPRHLLLWRRRWALDLLHVRRLVRRWTLGVGWVR